MKEGFYLNKKPKGAENTPSWHHTHSYQCFMAVRPILKNGFPYTFLMFFTDHIKAFLIIKNTKKIYILKNIDEESRVHNIGLLGFFKIL